MGSDGDGDMGFDDDCGGVPGGTAGGGLDASDRAPGAVEVRPGSIYDAYMTVATSPRGRDLSPAEVAVAAAGVDVGAALGGRWPAGRAAALCKRASVHLADDDPFVALSVEITELVALYESGMGATHLADPRAKAMLGADWALVVGEMAGRGHPELGREVLSMAAREAIAMVAVETDELFSRLEACYDGRIPPRSLAEAAVVGARVIESSGLGLGATSIGGCCLVGMGAVVEDLPAAERGQVFNPVQYHEEMYAHYGEDYVVVSGCLEANAAYFWSWREIQMASGVEDILLNPDYAGEREPFVVRQMIRPLLGAVPGDLSHLAYLIGCAPLLGWFAAVPASYITHLTKIEHYELLRARQIERDAPVIEQRRGLELLRDGLGMAEVAPGKVVFGRDDQLRLEELVDWVVDTLTKDSVELGPYGKEFLSRSIGEVAEWAVGEQVSWSETGEIVGPASLCICGSDGDPACRCEPSRIVEERVELVYDALCWEVLEPFTALVAHQGPPTSPAGWPKRHGGAGISGASE